MAKVTELQIVKLASRLEAMSELLMDNSELEMDEGEFRQLVALADDMSECLGAWSNEDEDGEDD